MNFYDVSVMNEVFRQKDGEEAAQATATFQKKELDGNQKSAYKSFLGNTTDFHQRMCFSLIQASSLVEKAKQEGLHCYGTFCRCNSDETIIFPPHKYFYHSTGEEKESSVSLR